MVFRREILGLRDPLQVTTEDNGTEDTERQRGGRDDRRIHLLLARILHVAREEHVGQKLRNIVLVVSCLHALDFFLVSWLLPHPFSYPRWQEWEDVFKGLYLAPILEESAFRIVPIYLALKLGARPRHLVLLGLLTSVLFGALHRVPYSVIVQGMSGAAYFGLFFINRRSYASLVVAHALSNLAVHLTGYLQFWAQ